MSTLKKRVLTAFVVLCIVLWAVFFLPQLYFRVLVALVVLSAAYEWSNLFARKSILLSLALVVSLAIVIALQAVFLPMMFNLLFAGGVCVWLWAGVLAFARDQGALALMRMPVSFVIAVILLSGFVSAASWLQGYTQWAPFWLLYPMVLTWVSDSVAYFVGRQFGRRKLIPRVSPNKTWEGLVAGVLGSFFVGLLITSWFPMTLGARLGFAAVTLLCIIAGVFGDLAISLLKRLAQVKDSGQLLPGHGGMLDRLDSLLPAIVVFSLGVYFFPI